MMPNARNKEVYTKVEHADLSVDSNVQGSTIGTIDGTIDDFPIDETFEDENDVRGEGMEENRSMSLKCKDSTETAPDASTPHIAAGMELGNTKTRDNASNSKPLDGSASFWDYYSVLRRHPTYRAYLISHLCQHLGDAFVRIASVLIVEKLATSRNGNDSAKTGVALSYITLARLLPNTFFAPIGGVLADRLDRRHLMIGIDILSGAVVLGFFIALHYESLELFYVITSVRSALTATYYPATTGIVPLLMTKSTNPGTNEPEVSHSDEKNEISRDLQLAVTMNAWAWSSSSVFGGIVTGTIASAIGLAGCYLIDFATYVISAFVITRFIRGEFRVNKDGDASNRGILQASCGELCTLFRYLSTCGFGMLVFLQGSASMVWGTEDIVGAQFATVYNEDGTEDEQRSSLQIGLLFSTSGLACILGPALFNMLSDGRKPHTLQRACWNGMLIMTCGWFVIYFLETFPQFLVVTLLRTIGSGTVWVYSTLILQTLSDPKVLGRVVASEYMIRMLFEAASVAVMGQLSKRGASRNMLALFAGLLGTCMLVLWGAYHLLSLGAAHPRFNNNYERFQPELEESMDKEEIEIGSMEIKNVRNSSTTGIV